MEQKESDSSSSDSEDAYTTPDTSFDSAEEKQKIEEIVQNDTKNQSTTTAKHNNSEGKKNGNTNATTSSNDNPKDEVKDFSLKTDLAKKGEEVEFVVKNLDTGITFSSKEIDKYIPKVDPIVKFIKKNSSTTEVLEQIRKDGKESKKKKTSIRGQKWLAKITRKKTHASEGSPSTSPPSQKKDSKNKTLFAQILRQQINEHFGSIWVMRFNYDGLYLASGGDDKVLRVWTVMEQDTTGTNAFFLPEVLALDGHTDSILAISWSYSRRNLLLSASLDKTVRLWNIKAKECEKVFEHAEVVTAVEMHPQDEDLFITGCLDNKLRIWSIRDAKVLNLVAVDCGYMTSITFTPDGSKILTGSHDGQCSFFDTQLKLEHRHMIKTSKQKTGKIITGFSMHPNGKQVLITSNDSRVRLFDLKDHTMICIYKGLKNKHFSQIYASISEKGTYVISGSEDHYVYLWEANGFKPKKSGKPPKVQYHDSFKAHGSTATVAVFAPFSRRKSKMVEGQILVTADCTGEIKVFENKILNKDKGASV